MIVLLRFGVCQEHKEDCKLDENEKEKENYVKLEGVEGLWYEQPDMLSKYKRRPDELEEICYTHFGKMIRSGGKMINSKESEPEVK